MGNIFARGWKLPTVMTWSHLDRHRNEILYTQIKYSKPFFIADHKRSRLYDSKTPKSDLRWPDVIVGVNCKPVTPAQKKLSSKRNETLVKGTDIAYFIWNLTSLLQFCTMRAPHNSLKKRANGVTKWRDKEFIVLLPTLHSTQPVGSRYLNICFAFDPL